MRAEPVSYVDVEETLMECCEPGAIREGELTAYIDGEQIRPFVLDHLARCQHCSALVATYRRMELKLLNQLYRWDCPPSQILGDYQLGLLDSKLTADVQSHLLRCVLCAQEVATLSEFLAHDPLLAERVPALQEDGAALSPSLNHYPAQDMQRALNYVRERAIAGTRRIIATLLPPQPRIALQRDVAAQVPSWPRRYVAEDTQVSLQVERGSEQRGALQLLGFVTRQGLPVEALQGTPVQLSSGADAAHTVYTQYIDELGNFVFSSLAPATYALEVPLPEGTVVIDQISVDPQDEL